LPSYTVLAIVGLIAVLFGGWLLLHPPADKAGGTFPVVGKIEGPVGLVVMVLGVAALWGSYGAPPFGKGPNATPTASASSPTTRLPVPPTTVSTAPSSSPPSRTATFQLRYTDYTAYLDLQNWKSYNGDQDEPSSGVTGLSMTKTVIKGEGGVTVAVATTQAENADRSACPETRMTDKQFDAAARMTPLWFCAQLPDGGVALAKLADIPTSPDFVAPIHVKLWSPSD
jgi:hypothetical protein